MSGITKRDAAKLVADIRNANVVGHAIAARCGASSHAALAGFVGGLESVLQHFLLRKGCSEAAAALVRAMNDAPTDAEIAAHNAQVASNHAKATGSAA